MPVADLIAELKRRRVFRVLVGYGVVAFAVLQVVEPIQHALGLSDAVVLKAVVVLLGLGFPVALVLGWAFDVNAGAIERTPPAAGARFPPAVTLAALAGAGVLIAVPGVAWFLLARRPAPAVPSGGDVTPAAPAAVPSAADPGPAGPKPQPAPSIAVLPLVNLSPDKEQDYFSDGLAEELLNLLAQVPGLHVSARTPTHLDDGALWDGEQDPGVAARGRREREGVGECGRTSSERAVRTTGAGRQAVRGLQRELHPTSPRNLADVRPLRYNPSCSHPDGG